MAVNLRSEFHLPPCLALAFDFDNLPMECKKKCCEKFKKKGKKACKTCPKR